MPDLYVIAGPNGAGKSTFSGLLVPEGLNVFDADKLLAAREKQFPGIDPAILMDSILSYEFKDGKEAAILSGKDFAYETNFANGNPLATPHEFRMAGYRINMIFVGLRSAKMAAQRVNDRKNLGGHYVGNAEIKSNYEAGLKNLRQHLRYFDRGLVLSSEKSEKLALFRQLFRTEKGIIVERAPKLPKWAQKVAFELPLKVEESVAVSRGKRR